MRRSTMKMKGTPSSPVFQVVLEGLGVCYVQSVGNELHVKAQTGLQMQSTGNLTDGMVIKFKREEDVTH